MKKYTLGTIAVILVFSLFFCSCRKDNSPEETTSGQNETTSYISTPETLEVTLDDITDSMIVPFKALAFMSMETDIKYKANDATCFWRAIGYLVGNAGADNKNAKISNDSTLITLPEGELSYYISALFADWNQKLPKLPSDCDTVTHNSDNTYSFISMSFGDLKIEITDMVDNKDNTFIITADLKTSGNASSSVILGSYEYVIAKNVTDYSSLYKYSVKSFKSLSANPDSEFISKSDALTMIKNKYGTKDDTTGNDYQYEFIDIQTINSSQYYNYSMSVKSGDSYAFLYNVFVLLNGSDIHMASKDASGNWTLISD